MIINNYNCNITIVTTINTVTTIAIKTIIIIIIIIIITIMMIILATSEDRVGESMVRAKSTIVLPMRMIPEEDAVSEVT